MSAELSENMYTPAFKLLRSHRSAVTRFAVAIKCVGYTVGSIESVTWFIFRLRSVDTDLRGSHVL